MIKYESTKGKTSIECSGPLHEIGADILTLIHLTYDGINEQNEKAGEEFKKMILENVSMSFESDESISEKMEELKKRTSEKGKSDLASDLADALKELVDELFS